MPVLALFSTMAGIKFGRKVKIVEDYEKLFDDKFYDTLVKSSDRKEASEFWNEYFLLKANPVELEKIIRQQLVNCAASHQSTSHGSATQSDQPTDQLNGAIFENGVHQNHQTHEIIITLFDQCILILTDQDDKLKQLNSILTLYVIMMVIMKQSTKKSTAINQCPIRLSADRLASLNESLMKLLDHYSNTSPVGESKREQHTKTEDYELVKLIIKLYLCILCKDDDLSDNEWIDLLQCDQLFERLFKIVMVNSYQANSESIDRLNHLSLTMITFMQNYRSAHQINEPNQNHQKTNLFTVKLSLLENEIALNCYAQVISKEINDFNQEYRREFYSPQAGQGGAMESIFSALSGLVLSNRNDQQTSRFERILLQSDKRPILLALYDMIHLNRNFIPYLLTNHSIGGEEANNLLINFIEFSSIIIFCLKEYFQRGGEQLQKKLTITIRLCFIILTCVVEDQFANRVMHDSSNVFSKVQIYRSKMRHRPIASTSTATAAVDTSNPTKSNRPIAYSILDLMVEFLFSNLRKKHFPIGLYVYCNNIILKLLCHQIKFECRKEFNWNELWHSLFCLLKYLTVNYDKDDLQVKRRSRMLLLANNVVNLFNLFIIFGDTFLHSPIDYDNLYYELLRNHDVFDSLASLAKHHSVSKKKDEKEAALKVLDSLDNVESIISHFISKINEVKSEPPLSEEEIREIVRNNYDTLSIKVKEGLEIYENYEPEKPFFKKKVLKKVMEQVRTAHLTNLDELISDQNVILQSILNC